VKSSENTQSCPSAWTWIVWQSVYILFTYSTSATSLLSSAEHMIDRKASSRKGEGLLEPFLESEEWLPSRILVWLAVVVVALSGNLLNH
jgi:hypothetical protein